jgi:hypothetical protein
MTATRFGPESAAFRISVLKSRIIDLDVAVGNELSEAGRSGRSRYAGRCPDPHFAARFSGDSSISQQLPV